jgi:hypothetical protein
MKQLLLLITGCLLTTFIQGQTNAVDELFEKYYGKDGFTTVYISSKMFSMFGSQDSKDQELSDLMKKLKSIRILTVEDSLLNKNLNFYEELRKKIDFSSYEELMAVKDANSTTKFLIKESGNTIAELLVISGGQGGNALISIRGDLDMKNISGLSKTLGIQQLENLEKIDQKPVKK